MRGLTGFRTAWLLAGLTLVACGGGSAGGDDLQVDQVSPDHVSARGGAVLQIEGQGFRTGATVQLGDQALVVVDTTDASVTAITARKLAGTYDVTVTNPNGDAVTLEQAVTVEPLELTFREAAAHYLPDIGDQTLSDAVAGDVDGDGDLDVLLAVSGGQSLLLMNEGNGTFTARATDPDAGPGLPELEQVTRALVLADLDGDGDLDLFGCSGAGERNRVLYNDGTGRFRDVDALLPRVGSCVRAAAADLDGDGLPELVVVAAKEGIDATRLVRVYRNRSTPTSLRFDIDPDLEVPVTLAGEDVGSIWAGSDPTHSATFRLSTDAPAAGTSCGQATYDFAGVDGYVLFYLPAPQVAFVPDELHLQLRGDGSGHRLTVRIRDASGERFTHEIGLVQDTTWQTVTAAAPSTWDHFGGNDDGVVDLPLDRVTLQLDREAGGPDQGSLSIDDVGLTHPVRGDVLVEDFERAVPALGFLDDVFSGITVADLDGDGALDLALTASASPTGAYLRILLNDRTPGTEGDAVLRFLENGTVSPTSAVAWSVPLDLEADGDTDLMLLTAGQDRAFVNDGDAIFFDDSVSLLPVDRVDGRHAAVGDLDLDGLSDVVIANHGEANRLYLGAWDGRLLDHTPALGLQRQASRWVLILDADGDGVQDVLVVNDEAPRLQLFISADPGGP